MFSENGKIHRVMSDVGVAGVAGLDIGRYEALRCKSSLALLYLLDRPKA